MAGPVVNDFSHFPRYHARFEMVARCVAGSRDGGVCRVIRGTQGRACVLSCIEAREGGGVARDSPTRPNSD